MGGGAATCGTQELIIFLLAIVSGTGSSITSKLLLQMKSTGLTGEVELFQCPLFQTFGMFLGMLAALVMHFIVVAYRLPFPGYKHPKIRGNYKAIANGEAEEPDPPALPGWMYFFLIIPSLFDLAATALCMFGLMYVNVSIYQMLRGSGIVFVALMKQYGLGDNLKRFMWIGVFWNVVSVLLVGATALLSASEATEEDSDENNNAAIGVALILAGALVQSLQFVFEEKVMTMEIAAPPLLMVGMEGLWGTLLCLTVLYPVAYYTPGSDHGSYENPFNTWAMLSNSADLSWVFFIYFLSVFLYNLFACLVTFMLNSVWHAILDNFRPITVWCTDMFIFYHISSSLGESWTKWCWVQLGGMLVLFYGTAIYNAPNAGSLKLEGQWWAFGINLNAEYRELEEEMEDVALDAKAANKTVPSPYMHNMSPFLTPGGSRVTPRGTRTRPQGYGATGAEMEMLKANTRRNSGV